MTPLVALTLNDSGDPPLKRNLRESLRRSRNRMAKVPGAWRFDQSGPSDPTWAQACRDLEALHHERAAMRGRVPHKDVFDGTRQGSFLARLPHASSATTPMVFRLLLDEVATAALLTFNAPGLMWVSISGTSAEHWGLNGVTALQFEAVKSARRGGRDLVVFSTGVDTAKLRWAETVRVSHQFVAVNPRRRSQYAFNLYWLLRSYRYVHRESQRFARRSR